MISIYPLAKVISKFTVLLILIITAGLRVGTSSYSHELQILEAGNGMNMTLVEEIVEEKEVVRPERPVIKIFIDQSGLLLLKSDAFLHQFHADPGHPPPELYS